MKPVPKQDIEGFRQSRDLNGTHWPAWTAVHNGHWCIINQGDLSKDYFGMIDGNLIGTRKTGIYMARALIKVANELPKGPHDEA